MSRKTMVIRLFAGLIATLAISAAASAQPMSPPGVAAGYGAGVTDVSFFYQELSPYGEWVNMPPYGWVWSPYSMPYDWRPYQNGRWVQTECGWTWMSNEPFGWATYHYGRWHYDPQFGWVWVPGTVWGPAWVAWREGGGWTGWAPLPPDDTLHVGLHIGRLNFEFGAIRRFHWNFVETTRFCEPNLRPHIARSVRNVNIVNQTQNVTNYNVVNNTVINNSINVNQIEKRIGRPVPKYTIQNAAAPTQAAIVKNNAIQLFRPKLAETAPKKTPDLLLPAPKPLPPKSNAAVENQKRVDQERTELQKRLTAEKAALEDRQKREAARAGKAGISADELRKRQQLERAAFEEQDQRQKKLLERYEQRDQKGLNGRTKADTRKFKFDEATKQK